MTCFRPLSGSYISQCKRKTKGENHEQFPSPIGELHFSIDELIPIARDIQCFRPLSGSYISQFTITSFTSFPVALFPSPIGELHFSIPRAAINDLLPFRFRPLSGSYISQYHPRNPMSCLGRIGGLRGKSNFIEIQLFWKVKSSHKSSI